MKTSKPESILRDQVSKVMKGRWHLTWHEDREINPGVPDISYVLSGRGDHETGWLELKAVGTKKGTMFHVEPSQHQWMAVHAPLVPAHFLVAVGDVWYLIAGVYHMALASTTSEDTLNKIRIAKMTKDTASAVLPRVLGELTIRSRVR